MCGGGLKAWYRVVSLSRIRTNRPPGSGRVLEGEGVGMGVGVGVVYCYSAMRAHGDPDPLPTWGLGGR